MVGSGLARQRLDLRLHFPGALEAAFPFLFQSAEDDLIHEGVDSGFLRGGGEPADGQLAGEHFIKDHPERINIRAVVHLAGVFDLLRGHVGHGAEACTAEGQAEFLAAGLTQLGDTEISDFHAAPGVEEEILRLDIAVEDALAVGVLEGLADSGDDFQRLFRGEAFCPHGLAQIHAIDVFHEQEIPAALLAEIVHGDDVRMIQLRERPGLAVEAFGKGRVSGERPGQDLERHIALQFRLPDLENSPHAAVADHFPDLQGRKRLGDFLPRWQMHHVLQHLGRLRDAEHETAWTKALGGTIGNGIAALGAGGRGRSVHTMAS